MTRLSNAPAGRYTTERFGNHAAIACHVANESYFRQAPVRWDEATRSVTS